ncbi:hypothetical protein FS837_007921 [Tulasnella sp. UAMH 9824]|nr:hypothetical protein FS837_007921 [Tulasnella sp. UAMH 9824]
MFAKLFPSRRSTTAGSRPEFKTGPSSSDQTATKPSSKLIRKLQELKQALQPRRSGQLKQQRAKQANDDHMQGKHSPAWADEHIGNAKLGPRSLLHRPRRHVNSSVAPLSPVASAACVASSATPESRFPVSAPSTRLPPTTKAPARDPRRLQEPTSTSELVENYPRARRRIIELRAMQEQLKLDETRGPEAIRTRRVQVVAPLTTTTIQQSSWEVASLELAKGKTTPAANLDVKQKGRTQERRGSILDGCHPGSQPSLSAINKSQGAEDFSHHNAVQNSAPNAGLWLGKKIHQGPAPNSKPVQKRSPLLDSAPVRFNPKMFEGYPRRHNTDFYKH